jgi:hypothetical protein
MSLLNTFRVGQRADFLACHAGSHGAGEGRVVAVQPASVMVETREGLIEFRATPMQIEEGGEVFVFDVLTVENLTPRS